MSDSDRKGGAAIGSPPGARTDMADAHTEEHDHDNDDARPQAVSYAPERRDTQGSPAFAIYKPNQGTRVRWGSAIGAAVLCAWGAQFVWTWMPRIVNNQTARTLVPVALLVIAAYFIFRLIGQNRRIVDFMIATESEMKKVNWSTRREVLGATRVVIFTVFAMSFLLFLVDLLFILFFSSINVLRIDVSALFGFGKGS